MNPFALLFLVAGLALIGWLTGRARGTRFAAAGGSQRPHSLPGQHGWYVALWIAVPALAFVAIWSAIEPGLVAGAVLADPAATALPAFGFERTAILSEARALADGSAYGAFYPLSERLAPAFGLQDGQLAKLHALERGEARAAILALAAAADGGAVLGWAAVLHLAVFMGTKGAAHDECYSQNRSC